MKVVTIHEKIRIKPDVAEQEAVKRARQVLETATEYIDTNGASLPDCRELSINGASDAVGAAQRALPVYSLALVTNERKLRRDAWHRMTIRLNLAKAKLDYIRAQRGHAHLIGGPRPADGQELSALNAYKVAVRQLLLTPAPTKAGLGMKRRLGGYDMKNCEKLRAAYERDVARLEK